MDKNPEDAGLTTQEALYRLCNEIESVLQQFKQSQSNRESTNWIREALQYSNQYTTINWITILFQIWLIFSLLITIIVDGKLATILECCIVLILLIINVIIELYENRLRYNEIPNRIKSIVGKIRANCNQIEWLPDNYPNLFSPYSPCITLQWTYRDNKLINLPWSLLVKDDVILVRPGQHSPGYCEALDKTNQEYQLLHYKQVYLPTVKNPDEIFSAPKLRKPIKNRKYRLLETPYLNNLRIYLEQSLERPCTLLNQQRYLIMMTIIGRILTPFVFLLVVFINLFKYFYYTQKDFIELFLIAPNLAVLPLLPLVFPLFWNLINYLGMAKFIGIFENSRKIDFKPNPLEEDTDTTTIDYTEIKLTKKQIWQNFIKILKGNPQILCRSSNILHVFGSVTALGCVDKKGVLSWPNPTAEKVFFLHNNDLSPSSSLSNVGDLIVDHDGGGDDNTNEKSINLAAIAEVLDLTHNHSDPFKLHFDDQDWDKFLTSLKPLGLGILLNTCNVDTQENYAQFCSHITCEAAYNESLIPITNRRCLCELAKEIGFVDQAQKIFVLEQQLSTFRHLQPEMVRRDNKYARSLQMSTKLKFPFPHMFAVIVKELSSGSMQLLSEGTADIILDSCVDYWDGHDLAPLTVSDRKKIQDFYQRSSLTAYCTAFAYRPLNKIINNQINHWYLELPSDSRHLYSDYRSPTPVRWDCSKSVLEPKIKVPIGQFYSTDSLLYNDCPSTDASDAATCFHMQCNQVFIGMVTMQYQPLTDMVQLIEQLERACIRFVHFSKENELRSRVFSEKMGLESGWNCHISLLSERSRRNSGQTPITNLRNNKQRRLSQSVKKLTTAETTTTTTTTTTTYDFSDSIFETSRALSFSAPSAINMEHSTVKFETNLNKTECYTSSKLTSNDSLQINNNNDQSTHDWQSLSCLTDSTEHSAPINFDMSNRAKLPRGIDKIRPHIEQIDNVPLLVSLFTDCTPNATREMLNIMQDYREIVCIMGSSASCENAGIFMQADASVAIQPLFPQVCQKIQVYQQSFGLSPIDVARDLNSIACSLSLSREDPISFYHLIMEARHFVLITLNSIQFWLLCCLLLSLLQILTDILVVPVPFTVGQLLWLCCIVVPVLSCSLLGLQVDTEIMKQPQIKNNATINFNLILFILWCYGLKFLPTIIVCIVIYLGILTEHCQQLCSIHIQNCTCLSLYLPEIDGSIGWLDNSWTILTARLIIVFIILLHYVVISIGFVHRDHLIFRKLPNTNGYWLCSVFTLIIIQSIYTIVAFNIAPNDFEEIYQFRVPFWVVLFASLSPFIVLIINELVKRQEIIVKKRSQKRARLDFGTKLGMNSPF